MTDAEYLFKQNEINTKRIARGNFNKKRGGGRHVRLPSDTLTKAQKNKLNGEPITMNMKKPMTWKQLKMFPKDVQREYLLGLQERFDPTSKMLTEMLRVNSTYMGTIYRTVGVQTRQGHKPSPDIGAWQSFLNGEAVEPAPLKTPEEPAPVEENTVPEVVSTRLIETPEDLPPKQKEQLLSFCQGLSDIGVKSFSFSVQF